MTEETTTIPAPVATPLVALTPAPWNPRTISDERFQNLCRSIEQDPDFLGLRPILATEDGTIFAGNMRYRAAKHRGWPELPAIPPALRGETCLQRTTPRAICALNAPLRTFEKRASKGDDSTCALHVDVTRLRISNMKNEH